MVKVARDGGGDGQGLVADRDAAGGQGWMWWSWDAGGGQGLVEVTRG